MVVAVLAFFGLATSVAVARAAYRASVLLRQVPPEFFLAQHSKGAAKGRVFYPGGFASRMTPEEARMMLGVPINASKSLITSQHRKLLSYNHPDKGGSSYLAQKLNEAKTLLVKGKN